MENGIEVTDLLKSDIFNHRLDCDDWPAIHEDNKSLLIPYNNSPYKLRGKYKRLFAHRLKKSSMDN